MRSLFLFSILLAAAFAGCATTDDTVRIAFVSKDTALEPAAHPDRLADWITEQTGRPAEAFFFDSSNAALEALRFGQADIASVDGAAGWLAWQRLGLETIASEVRSDGRTHYIAAAWVQADSPITTVDDLAGVTSCHTGATKSAGMLMPMSYLIANDLIDASAYRDDISEVQQMARDFFDEPVIGGEFAGYEGALRCLSTGAGEVAFVRDTTPTDYCEHDAPDWCLGLDDYRLLQEFGPVPEHPIMVSPDTTDAAVADVLTALLALNDSPAGLAILDDVFGTDGIAAVPGSDAHLGGYGALVGHLPGITEYAESK